MDTLIGKTLSHYRIVEKIGAGGMGEVYRARDTHLGRDVAIKALPEAFASDAERLVRFEREAKVLASLSHPNLAGIYGVEEAGGRRYLALELVEGETLAARLARGPLPIDEAVDVCLQIAAGMEAAHEAGVVHRDLKPGNVMITPADQVKVVDFGLAKGKVAERESGSPDSPTMTESPVLHESPTVGTPATLPGVILGTAAYLSPEQARGKAVDRRTDIWSFGCVLYECLTGRRAFEGETTTDLVAAILRADVDWSRLPKGTPPRIRDLLQHCLEKDPRKRLRDMGDARLALEEIRERIGVGEPAEAPRPGWPRAIAFAIVFALLGAAAGIALWSRVGPGRGAVSPTRGASRVSIDIPSDIHARSCGISPDGRYLIVLGLRPQLPGRQEGGYCLYLRPMDSSAFKVFEGSRGIAAIAWDDEGRWLFFTRSVSAGAPDLCLMKVLLDGSAPPVTVTNWDPAWDPGSMNPLTDGDVLIGIRGGLAYVRVPASGAAPSAPTKFDLPGSGVTADFSNTLPGDRGVLLNTLKYGGERFGQGVGLLDLRSGKTRILLRDGGNASYCPTGHLVFTRGSTLLAVPFDLKRLEIQGEPLAVAEGLFARHTYANAEFTISRTGTLLYRYGGLVGGRRHLIVVDGGGRVSDWTRDRGAHDDAPSVSPDGSRVAYALASARGVDEIWVSERGGASSRRVAAMEGADCARAVWAPDGARIAFYRHGSDPEDGVYVQSVEGGPPRRICRRDSSSSTDVVPTSWSPDGRDLLADAYGRSGRDIVRIPTGAAGDSLSAPVPLLSGPGDQMDARFSPDGRWVAYCSDESGIWRICVALYRPDRSLGPPVSVGPGLRPRWSRSGRELFFVQSRTISSRTRMVSVSIHDEPALRASEPVPRWDLDSLRCWTGVGGDILPGDRLVIVQKGEDEEADADITRFACVFNFFDELKEKVRAAAKR